MIYKKVAKIDEQISAIGIGCWGFGGDWDTSNDKNAFEIIHAAVDLGINLFDVAPVYGWTHAESLLGRALKEGGGASVVVNGANELAVDAFLKERIGFTQIPALVERAMDAFAGAKVSSVEDVLALDHEARAKVESWL